MRQQTYLIAGLTIICAAQIVSQETLSTTGQSLEGTWIAQVAPPGGDFVPFGLGTFSPNGSYLGTSTDPSQSNHHGVWLRVGDRKFVLSTMFFTNVLHARRERCLQRHREDKDSYYPGQRNEIV